MSDALYRTVVGPVMPVRDDDEVPTPYRRTVPLPPAPKLLGSVLNEPHGDFRPTVEYPANPPLPY